MRAPTLHKQHKRLPDKTMALLCHLLLRHMQRKETQQQQKVLVICHSRQNPFIQPQTAASPRRRHGRRLHPPRRMQQTR